MRALMKRFGWKKAVGILIAGTVVFSGGMVLAQSGDPETEPPEENSPAEAAAMSSQLLETRFVPVAPCRMVDTRQTSPIAAGTIRQFDAFGTDLSGQGGSGSGCGIPARAGAISVNITAVNQQGKGFLRAGPGCFRIFLSPPCSPTLPNATALNYSKALNASNGVDIPLCTDYPTLATGIFTILGSCQAEFNLGTFNNTSNVVVDVTGYYARPIFAMVDGDQTAAGNPAEVDRSSGITSVQHTNTGVYIVNPADDIRGCAISVSPTSSDSGQSPDSAGTVRAQTQSDSDIVVNTYNGTGTLSDNEFTVVVAC